MLPKSPITESENVVKEKEIIAQIIIDGYKKFLQMDVARFFSDCPAVEIYKCQDTGYRFYYPFNLEGDSAFYEQLEKFPWYYMTDKWEHKIALKFISPSDKVLEVGCGGGAFLKDLSKVKASGTGLELNEHALKQANTEGLNVYPHTVQDYALQHQNQYEVVCSFQVMEHIVKVKEVLDAQIALLKPGGKLIFSVPNNQAFIKNDKYGFLNMPPHHLGMWDKESLYNFTKFFPLTLEGMYFEPLQRYHYRYYYQVYVGNVVQDYLGYVGKIINKIISTSLIPVMALFAKKIKGHTILAVYRKN